jgi:hypothetical protein
MRLIAFLCALELNSKKLLNSKYKKHGFRCQVFDLLFITVSGFGPSLEFSDSSSDPDLDPQHWFQNGCGYWSITCTVFVWLSLL